MRGKRRWRTARKDPGQEDPPWFTVGQKIARLTCRSPSDTINDIGFVSFTLKLLSLPSMAGTSGFASNAAGSMSYQSLMKVKGVAVGVWLGTISDAVKSHPMAPAEEWKPLEKEKQRKNENSENSPRAFISSYYYCICRSVNMYMCDLYG